MRLPITPLPDVDESDSLDAWLAWDAAVAIAAGEWPEVPAPEFEQAKRIPFHQSGEFL